MSSQVAGFDGRPPAARLASAPAATKARAPGWGTAHARRLRTLATIRRQFACARVAQVRLRATPQIDKPMDSVCGVRVDTGSAAASSEYKGFVYYFHSKACKAEFDAAPERFAER